MVYVIVKLVCVIVGMVLLVQHVKLKIVLEMLPLVHHVVDKVIVTILPRFIPCMATPMGIISIVEYIQVHGMHSYGMNVSVV